ncbi:hypothetical protein LWI28_002421 [Acer negundo]|uniref:DUF4283 domain-containing protein n=1 Tax=Acer negundo TaxID=4023 RepID=A0AAD5NRY9_ACENE|nr:hypothetical protein LWI28_002421 [Acer negundo]
MYMDGRQNFIGGNIGIFNGEPYIFRGKQSFATVVKEVCANTCGSSDQLGCLEMSWKIQNEAEELLARSAIKVLRDFFDVNLVELKLEARCFAFTSTYLGGKSVVWTFESEMDKDGFIRNRFFWSDNFISMSIWSESSVSLDRPRWLEVYNVPLHCWCKDFFTEVGGQAGETVWVENSTIRRERIDRGRILVLVPFEFQKDREVVVKFGENSFLVKITASPESVSMDWITLHLALKPVLKHRESEVERSLFTRPMNVNSPISEERGQLDRDKVSIARDFWVPEKTKEG